MAHLKWIGRWNDIRAGEYRVFSSSGAWTLSHAGKRLSRHDKRDHAKIAGRRHAAKTATGRRHAAKTAAAHEKCEHRSEDRSSLTQYRETGYWGDPEIDRCTACGEYLSLGRSNDLPCAIAIEIRAVRLADGARSRKAETIGMTMHGIDEEGIDGSASARLTDDVHAGYLCRELRTHERREERDAKAWPWDPSRPVAGQHEERVSRVTTVAHKIGEHDQAEDAFRDPAVTAHNAEVSQRRAIAGATAARHADLDAVADGLCAGAMRGATPDEIDAEVDRIAGEMRGTMPDEIDAEVDRIAGWGRDLDAIEYEHTRQAAPDLRDEDDPTIEALIERSSVGVGLTNIAANGIDAELADLEAELHDPQVEAVLTEAFAAPSRPLTDAQLQPLVSWPPHTGCDPREVP